MVSSRDSAFGRQALCFCRACRSKGLDLSVYPLYFALLCRCYEVAGRKHDAWSCRLSNKELLGLSGIGSLATFYRLRKLLVSAGLVRYMSGRKGGPSLYRLSWLGE